MSARKAVSDLEDAAYPSLTKMVIDEDEKEQNMKETIEREKAASDAVRNLRKTIKDEKKAHETYTVETVLLAQTGAVPDRCDALVVAGPTRPWLGVEHEALNAYLAKFQSDAPAWHELAELYLSAGAYRRAAFCLEELLLHDKHGNLVFLGGCGAHHAAPNHTLFDHAKRATREMWAQTRTSTTRCRVPAPPIHHSLPGDGHAS